MRRKLVDDRSTRIPVAEQLRNLVECFARRIVAGFSQKPIFKSLPDFEEMRVAAADHQRQRRISDRIARFQHDRVDMPFDMIHRNQRNASREAY